MIDKDGKVLCFGCGRRLNGMISKGHAAGCPFGQAMKK